MNAAIAETSPTPGNTGVSAGMTFLFAVACGLIAANIYYAQPLAGPIAEDIGLPHAAAGLIVTLTQIGYGLGLLFVVPLCDLVENRRMILIMIGLCVVALLGAAFSGAVVPFLLFSLLIGIASATVQMIVPLAAGLASEQHRGRVVGNVMSGLMTGIMLARPVSSLVASLSSWHGIFYLSAAAMIVLGIVMARRLPQRQPQARLGYGALIGSMVEVVRTEPVLRRRALYQAFQFAAFSIFWTVTPLYLAGPAFGLTQTGIALFALAGVAGAIASPIAGRLADRGFSRPATFLGMGLVGSAFLVSHIFAEGSVLALAVLVAAGILLDFGTTTTLVLSQRAIYGLGAEKRSRINAIFMATFFMAGAAGSALGAWAFASGGWFFASTIGIAMPVIAILYALTERR